jgi:dihydrofolate reductase
VEDPIDMLSLRRLVKHLLNCTLWFGGDRHRRIEMAAVRWHVVMSLDGYVAAPGDDMGWVFDVAGPSDTVDDMVRTTGAVVMGRRTYEVEDRDRPGIYGGAWKGPLFVLTHDPPATVPEWMSGTFVHDGVEAAVEKARAAAGDGKVGILGAGIARQCIEAGLLDEIVVQVAPILLGDGVRLFDSPGGGRIALERTGLTESGRLTDLSFRVAR